jgi:hypothetical protein
MTTPTNKQSEPDFLPDWYAAAARSRRRTTLAGSASVTLITILGLVTLGGWFDVATASAHLDDRTRDVEQSRLEIGQLEQNLGLRTELRTSEQVAADIGLTVETSRVLAAVEKSLPASMSLQDLKITLRTSRPTGGSALARLAGHNDAKPGSELAVEIKAITTAHRSITQFAKRLDEVPALDDVLVASSNRAALPGGGDQWSVTLTFTVPLPSAG